MCVRVHIYRFIHSFIYSFTCLFICLYMCFDYSVMFFIYSFRDLSIRPCAHRCILYISKHMRVYAYEHVLSYCIIITIFCLGMYWLQPWGAVFTVDPAITMQREVSVLWGLPWVSLLSHVLQNGVP